jgi:hypothetical protein
MATVISYQESGFIGQALKINGKTVCILHPTTATDQAMQALARRLMRGQGIDCRQCAGCPVGLN